MIDSTANVQGHQWSCAHLKTEPRQTATFKTSLRRGSRRVDLDPCLTGHSSPNATFAAVNPVQPSQMLLPRRASSDKGYT